MHLRAALSNHNLLDSFRPKALVLGERALAREIAKQLCEEGFDPVFQNELNFKRLPTLTDRNSFAKMRALFTEFASIAPGKNAVIHPGVTIWAERPELESIAREFGFSVICPPSRILMLFGNKLNFLFEAERLQIPHLVQGFEPMHTVREILAYHNRNKVTFPVVLKSVKSAGSAGVCVIPDLETLSSQLPLWLEYLRRNFGEAIFFAERYLGEARHVVVPFARFPDGRFQAFPTLDSSLQSKHRKIVEFCPANRVDPEANQEMLYWTSRFADHCGYVGVGSIEFLVDGSRVYIVGGLSRLTSSFHLWDQIAGTRAVSWQLATMKSNSAFPRSSLNQSHHGSSGDPSDKWSSGISMKLLAEDSKFALPRPGVIHELSSRRIWEEEEIRGEISLAYEAGENISSSSSGLLGVITIVSRDQSKVLPLAKTVLRETWAAGSIQCNDQFLLELLSHPWVNEEIFHAGFIDEDFVPSVDPTNEWVFLSANICESIRAQKNPGYWVIGQKKVKLEQCELLLPHWLEGPNEFRNEVGIGVSGVLRLSHGNSARFCGFPIEAGWIIRLGNWSARAKFIREVEMYENKPKLKLNALSPGRIHSILFREGTTIPPHEPLLMIESLGRFIPHSAPRAVRVTEWKVHAEEMVTLGQDLAELEYISTDQPN